PITFYVLFFIFPSTDIFAVSSCRSHCNKFNHYFPSTFHNNIQTTCADLITLLVACLVFSFPNTFANNSSSKSENVISDRFQICPITFYVLFFIFPSTDIFAVSSCRSHCNKFNHYFPSTFHNNIQTTCADLITLLVACLVFSFPNTFANNSSSKSENVISDRF